jgi:hypothetical protein
MKVNDYYYCYYYVFNYSIINTMKIDLAEPPPPSARMALALFDFHAMYDDELSFQMGDLIEIIDGAEEGQDWWKGSLNGKEGIIPSNYVQLS